MPTGKTIELLNIMEQAVKYNPEDPICYFYLGNLYSVVSRIPDAKKAYEKANELIDKSAVSPEFRYLADKESFRKALDRTQKEIDSLKNEFGSIETMSEEQKLKAAKLCMEKAMKSEMGDTARYFIYAIILAPNNRETALAYASAGGFYVSDEAADVSIYYYKKAIELNPELAEGYYGLAMMDIVLARKKDDQQKWQEAKELLEKAKNLAEKQGKTELLKIIKETLSQESVMKK